MMPSRGKGKSINGMFDADRKQLILNDSLLSRNSLSLSNITQNIVLCSQLSTRDCFLNSQTNMSCF